MAPWGPNSRRYSSPVDPATGRGYMRSVGQPSKDVGVAFSMRCDLGFTVGLCTHRHARLGALIWIAHDVWDEFPTCDDVLTIDRWRWPVFFPLGTALRRHMADRICRIAIPPELAEFPRLRNGGNGQPWMEYRDGELGPTTLDCDLPIAMIVNDTALKAMIVTAWMPVDRW